MAPHSSLPLPLTPHAVRRIRTRAISSAAIDYVLAYGREIRTRGATKVYLDRDARRRLAQEVGAHVVTGLGHKLDIAIVVGDSDRVITAMYRDRRVRH